MANYTQGNSQTEIQNRMLAKISASLDKRDGSLIQSVIGALAFAIQGYYYDLQSAEEDGFITTAEGEALDKKCAERAITRKSATYAIRKGKFDLEVGIDTLFNTMSGKDSLQYKTTSFLEKKDNFYYYEMVCQTAGIVGNGYEGSLTASSYIANLKVAQLEDIISPGEDIETDENLRNRYILSLREKPFAGNLSAYISELRTQEGVGAVQVYPFWQGGGTVLISFLDSEFNIPSEELIKKIQDYICPPEADEATPSANGYGLAPIGAKVTVKAPTKFDINITGNILIGTDYILNDVITEIKASIEDYLLSIRKKWADRISDKEIKYISSITYARITALIMNCKGVLNISNILVNGSVKDIELIENKERQEVPFINTINLNAIG